MAELWKSVSKPYWSEGYVCIDVVAQNLEEKVYYAFVNQEDEAVLNADWRPSIGPSAEFPERSRHICCSEYWVNEWFSPLPCDVIIALVNKERNIIFDAVRRTIPKKPIGEAKACKVSSEPSSSKNVDVGVKVPVKLVIRNCGMAAAPMGSSIEKDGVEIVSVYKDMINPGGTFEISTSFSMPNNVTKLKFEGYAWVNGAWSLDVNFTYTLTPIIGEAKGEITLCNINGSSCPNCGQANQGDEISVIAEMRNVGAVTGEFRFYIYDQDGQELSKEPDLSYKNVAAGAIWKVEKSLLVNLNFDMIDKTLNGTLKLVRQT